MSNIKPYRIRITKPQGGQSYVTYIVRNKNGAVHYMSASETPLALSNLIHDDAAAMRFALEDAPDGKEAASMLQAVLDGQWKNNKPLAPMVEVLS